MEHPCYKCGQSVEEGVPFCLHCSAPQIRVVVAAPPDQAAASLATPADPIDGPGSTAEFAIGMPIRWSAAVPPCALAGLIAALAMVLKLMIPVIAVLGAGFLGVVFYRRRLPGIAVRAMAGARLGALSSLFCFGIATTLEAVAIVVLRKGDEVRHVLLDAIQQTAARYPDPQFQTGLDFMRSPSGLVFMLVFMLIFALLTCLLLGTAGGALGGAILGRNDKT
jgi:hypothetical protein